MSTDILPFNYGTAVVRTVLIEGEPWFVLADLCKILDLPQVSRVKARLDDALTRSNPITDGLGRDQTVTIVSEAGMYEVVIRSDKPEAVAFRRWITGTVLPEIRKTGSYGQKALTPDEIVHQALQITAAKVERLEAKVAEDAPKVSYIDTYVADGDLRILRNVAKQLGVTEKQLREDLLNRKWIYKESATRWSERHQEKQTVTRYSPYASKAHLFAPVPNHEAPRFKGEVMHTLKVTPQGAIAIAKLYGIESLPAPVTEAVAS